MTRNHLVTARIMVRESAQDVTTDMANTCAAAAIDNPDLMTIFCVSIQPQQRIAPELPPAASYIQAKADMRMARPYPGRPQR